jgi:putative peptidoglycan lipid II flippase
MTRQSVVRGAGIMMAATVVSRLLGYLRDYVIGHTFGATTHTDAFWSAVLVPDLLYYLLAGGALGAAFIPVFTDYLARQDDAQAWRVANTIATVLMLGSALGVALIELFTPALVSITVPGLRHRPEAFRECVFFARIMAPMVLATTLSALSTAILQSYKHFTAPALAWAIYNLGIIFGALVIVPHIPSHEPRLRIMGLCLGVLIGAALTVLVQVPAMLRRGLAYRPTLDLKHPGVRLGISLLWFPYFFGSFFEEGVITAIRYANRLIILPLGLFGVTISTAVFPTLAERATLAQQDDLRRAANGAVRAISALSLPSAVGLVALAGPIIRVLWRGGQFDPAAAQASAFVLLFFAPGLVGLAAMQVLNRVFYAVKDCWTPPIVGVGYVALSIGLTLWLMRLPVGYGAIGLSAAIAWSLGFLVLLPLVRWRLGGFDLRGLVLSLLRIALASAALGVVSWYVARGVGQAFGLPGTDFRWTAPAIAATRRAELLGQVLHHSRLLSLVQVAAAMAAGAVVYVAALAALRAPELRTMKQAVQARLRRRSP